MWLGPCAKMRPCPKASVLCGGGACRRARRSVPVKARAHAMVGRLRMHWSTEGETGIFYSVLNEIAIDFTFETHILHIVC